MLSCFSCVRFFATPWTVACQAPLSMGFSRQEYWSGLPFPSSGDLPDPGIKPVTLTSLALVGRRRQWHPTPVLLPGKSHGRRSLVGCSPWGRKESDMTERLHFHFSLSCIGGGNGNPLQCLPGESQGQWSLVGCCLWGCTESDTTEAT